MTAWTFLFGILLFSTALFLILLVLVQRGRGGGLSGALGGMGGQSAFGTKAGDLFTRITIIVATFWILLCIGAILVLNPQVSTSSESSGEGVDYRTPTLERRGDKAEAEEPAGGATVGAKETTDAGQAEPKPDAAGAESTPDGAQAEPALDGAPLPETEQPEESPAPEK